MANTYTQVYLHIIFAVKNRASLLPATSLTRVHSYIGGVLKQHGHIPLAIGGIDNHIHIMVAYNIRQSISDMIRDIKSSSSRFINESRIIPFHFEWQSGYGCFSYSHSQINSVCEYINHQHEHHKSISLETEVRTILDRLGMTYDERYVIREP
ncbi:MAG: IS200/IS605 family transposase [Duncaniella sp.]